jgi:hypothetical protein
MATAVKIPLEAATAAAEPEDLAMLGSRLHQMNCRLVSAHQQRNRVVFSRLLGVLIILLAVFVVAWLR